MGSGAGTRSERETPETATGSTRSGSPAEPQAPSRSPTPAPSPRGSCPLPTRSRSPPAGRRARPAPRSSSECSTPRSHRRGSPAPTVPGPPARRPAAPPTLFVAVRSVGRRPLPEQLVERRGLLHDLVVLGVASELLHLRRLDRHRPQLHVYFHGDH